MSNVWSQVNELVHGLSSDELSRLARLAQFLANSKASSEIFIGDTVKFDAKSRGMKQGILVKKNRKTFEVLVGSVRWKVSPTLLKKVA